MKRFFPMMIAGLLIFAATAATAATADTSAHPASSEEGSAFAGTYLASLPTRSEILQLHADGTAEITLSDQVTSGAGGLTFSDSLGSWKVSGPRRLTARFLNLNFAGTDFSGNAVVDYVYLFGANLKTIAASCQGKIFAPGVDPFNPGSVPVVTFDCAYLTGHPYQRMPL
jgi:hypothetical protein